MGGGSTGHIERPSERTLLAVLGRGTQQLCEGGSWEPTEDLEVCDENFAHLPVRVPEDDNHPNSIIGGGKLNILAGAELFKQLHPAMAVFAYGFRSKYLAERKFPSESQVMTEAFEKLFGEDDSWPVTAPFHEHSWPEVKASGTLQELHNIFTAAKEWETPNIAVVTVAVHVPRTALMIKHHKADNTFASLRIELVASEYVLLRADPEKYGGRVNHIFGSQSYIRNFEREINGINALLSGSYKPIASVVR